MSAIVTKKQFSLATSSRAISQLHHSPLVVEAVHPRIARWEPGCEGSPIPQSRAISMFRKPKAIRIPDSPIGFGCQHFSSFAATFLKTPPSFESKAKPVGLGIDLLHLVSTPSSSNSPRIDHVGALVDNQDLCSSFISLPNPFPMVPFPASPVGLGISMLNSEGSNENIGMVTIDEMVIEEPVPLNTEKALLPFRVDRPQIPFDSPAW